MRELPSSYYHGAENKPQDATNHELEPRRVFLYPPRRQHLILEVEHSYYVVVEHLAIYRKPSSPAIVWRSLRGSWRFL